ncbi:hypothetical protein U1Q18_024363 [Sarracenia purpurea var. burkii]
MEALWNLEDKWKISTQQAVLLLACTAILVGMLCAATVLKRRAHRKQLVGQQPSEEDESTARKWSEPRTTGCGFIKKALMGSVLWSKSRKWEESSGGSRKELIMRESEAGVEWPSHNSTSPVWQRPILMGEKCELLRFSGLILYDERGRPVRHSEEGSTHQGFAIVPPAFTCSQGGMKRLSVGEFGPYLSAGGKSWALLLYVNVAVTTCF